MNRESFFQGKELDDLKRGAHELEVLGPRRYSSSLASPSQARLAAATEASADGIPTGDEVTLFQLLVLQHQSLISSAFYLTITPLNPNQP